MKKGIVIVNTARGAVMDESALVEALDSGQVSSAGLDVYEHEPRIHPGLLSNPRVLLVPHMGTWTVETETKMEEWCVHPVRGFGRFHRAGVWREIADNMSRAISNLRMAVEEGRLRTIVPEQREM